jgi:hypothetical protein
METQSPLNQKFPSPRTKLNVPIIFRRKYSRSDEKGQLKNISESGAFLAQKGEPLLVGSKIHIMLDFLGNKRELMAQVVWSNSNGSGIRFLPNVGRDKVAVQDFIEFINEQKSTRHSTLDLIFKKVG